MIRWVITMALAAWMISPCNALDKWTRTDTAFEAAAVASIAADWSQTLSIARGPWWETNPILGRYPSVRRVNAYFASCVLLHVAAARVLPRGGWRRTFQVVTVFVETGYITSNASMGIGLSVPW